MNGYIKTRTIEFVRRASELRKEKLGSPCRLVLCETKARRWKIVASRNGCTEAWGFVRHHDGAILMAASWTRPAKHARAYVTDDDFGMSGVDVHGPKHMAELKRRDK